MMDDGMQRTAEGKGGGGRRWVTVLLPNELVASVVSLAKHGRLSGGPFAPIAHLSCERVGVREEQREQAEADGEMDSRQKTVREQNGASADQGRVEKGRWRRTVVTASCNVIARSDCAVAAPQWSVGEATTAEELPQLLAACES